MNFGLDAVNPVAGGAGRRVAPSPRCQDSVNALLKFLHDLRMTGPAGVAAHSIGKRSIEGQSRTSGHGSVAAHTGYCSCLCMHAVFEKLPRRRSLSQGMLLNNVLVRVASVARLVQVRRMTVDLAFFSP